MSLKYLLDELSCWRYSDFEEWANDFWLNVTSYFYTSRLQFHALERLGLAPEALEAERARLEAWGADVAEFAFLAAANQEAPALDYTDPLTLKYFALWVWAADHADTDHGHELRADIRRGAIAWRTILDDDLLSLPAFNREA